MRPDNKFHIASDQACVSRRGELRGIRSRYGAVEARDVRGLVSILGINTNTINLEFFPTDLNEPVLADAERSTRNVVETCIGRNGNLSDIDGTILFLFSHASAYLT